MKNVKYGLLLTYMALSCSNPKPAEENNKPSPKIESATWLLGTWSNASADIINHETWVRYDDTTFVGSSFAIRDGDTISSENIRLVQDGDGLSYIPVVEGQNNGVAVTFKSTFIDSANMIFENKTHDFPQQISYRKISDDSLVAEISGVIKGVHRVEQFPMRKRLKK